MHICKIQITKCLNNDAKDMLNKFPLLTNVDFFSCKIKQISWCSCNNTICSKPHGHCTLALNVHVKRLTVCLTKFIFHFNIIYKDLVESN
jgi:hypothetical protein